MTVHRHPKNAARLIDWYYVQQNVTDVDVWLRRYTCPCRRCIDRRVQQRAVEEPGRWQGNEAAALRRNAPVLEAIVSV